jgi:predicted dehydrogenase
MTNRRIPRRDVLRSGAWAGLGLWLARSGNAGADAPNAKLNLAIVGCGGRGGDNLKDLGSENVVALCDADERQIGDAVKKYPKAQRFRDYRKMLDALGRSVDAVVVSTPDHMHAPVSLAAMQLGKHVYCEKPLTWGIAEARLMAKTAAEKKVATQMGTQGMATDGARAGIEALRTGVLGDINEVHVWTDRAAGWWPQGVERPAGSEPVPKGLDWDLWLGVAPKRPYHSAYCPFKWRGWKDFGTGAMGDMGIHNAAMVYVGLDLGLPHSAEVLKTSGFVKETFPSWSLLRVEFPASGNRGPVPLFWYEGGKKPPNTLIGGREVAANGAIVVGTKGTLYSIEWTGGDWHLLPEADFASFKRPAPSVPRAPGENHHREWIEACKGGKPAFCRFDGFAARLTETMLVGNLAVRTGKKIVYRPDLMKAEDCPEADPFIHREYRKGW